MNSQELRDYYAEYFFEKGDGLPSDLEHYELESSTSKSFTLIFPLGNEDETGDVSIEPFTSIFAQVRNFREHEDSTIEVTMTTPKAFAVDGDEELLEEILEISDDSWRHRFYLFITFTEEY